MKYKNREIEINKENDQIRLIPLSNPIENCSFNFDHFALTPDDDDDIIEAMIKEWIDDQEAVRQEFADLSGQ